MPVFLRLGAIFLFVTVLFSPALAGEKKRVLALHSYHKGLAWTDSLDEGLSAALRDSAKFEIELYAEHLDAKRMPDLRRAPVLARLIAEEYGPAFFDAVVVSDEDAFDFVRREHATLFPGAPVVFCGINYFEPSMLPPPGAEGHGLYTGVVEGYDVRSALEVALRLAPQTRRIVVVNDDSATGRANRKTLAETLPEFARRVDVLTLEDLDMEELLTRVRGLNETDLILLMTFNRDRSGRAFDYDESVRLIASAAQAGAGGAGVPLFGVWDFYLGKGIVGGRLTGGRDQGRIAGETVLRILGGTRPDAIPVTLEAPSLYGFDDNLLRRFRMDPELLPPGAVVINRPVTFYDQHREKVLAVGAAFLALSGMLVALLLNVARRKRTEADLRRSEEKFETIFRRGPDWIAILSLDEGRYLDVNEAFEAITGYGRAEVLGRTSLEVGIYEDPAQRYELDPALLTHGRAHEQEVRYRLKSGQVITVERSAELASIDGQTVVISIVRDVTSKRQALQAQAESERQRKLRVEAEIKMLQAQINPHFLFNAISTIRHHVLASPATAQDLLVKLGDFFRRNIRPGGRTVPLSKEIEHCRDYVAIEQARFEDRLRVAYVIDPAALNAQTPPLVLQPLVENAILHGVLPREEGGEVIIGAQIETGAQGRRHVAIHVRDNGVGMDQETAAGLLDDRESSDRPRKGVGMALVNVNARLLAVLGPDAGLRVESAPGAGTTISFRIPLEGEQPRTEAA